FFYFFDKEPLKSDSEFIIKSYHDIFFEKLFRDGYINIKVIIASLVKTDLKVNYHTIPEYNKKRRKIHDIMSKLLSSSREETYKLLTDIDNVFKKENIEFNQLDMNDKKVLITLHLLQFSEKNSFKDRRQQIFKTIMDSENYRKLVRIYIIKELTKHGENNEIYFNKGKIEYTGKIREELVLENDYIYYKNIVEIWTGSSIQRITERIKEIKKLQNNNDDEVFFRGHTDINYQLIPSVYRTEKSYLNEHLLCEESLARNPEEYKNSNNNHLNILKKMQHYGLPTRLLDVTQNLLVALFFAVENNFDKDGELIVFSSDKIKYTRSDNVSIIASLSFFDQCVKENIIEFANDSSISDDDFNNKEEVKRLKHEVSLEKPAFIQAIKKQTFKEDYFVVSTRDNKRISQQFGSFIICSLNKKNLNKLNCFRVESNTGKKVIIRIPYNKKSEFLEELELFGITHGFIYPEISEVAQFLKAKYC
ncbi:FRG domain-containing protein, partial [Enterococcus faecium]|nr:FRG domain-containing protein [Enterococcus faecium]